MLKSIEYPGGKVTVHYRSGDMEVMVVEIGGGGSLVDSTLWGRSSWHLVLEGQALVRVGGKIWELLPEESLSVELAAPYSILNPSPDRLRLLSVVRAGDTCEREEPQ
jgi:mannose-6-phosphate isomerase-like protein (cupin superfamily)